MLSDDEKKEIINHLFDGFLMRLLEDNVVSIKDPIDLENRKNEIQEYVNRCQHILTEWNSRDITNQPKEVEKELLGFVEIKPGMYVLDENKRKSLSEYISENEERIRQELLRLATTPNEG